GVDGAVCQAGVLHDVGDARAVVATAPDGTRGGIDDAVVRSFLGPTGGSFHMTCIILHSGAQRKAAFPPQVANLQTVLFAGTPTSAFGPISDCPAHQRSDNC